jgi:glycyl-tRNA synthetase beta chain
MVGEFPELQGIIGAKYLLAEKESYAVATAVLEHYQPRASGDAPPGSAGGAVVALAERLELLLSIFSIGERPSGSSDPYGLRRAGNGIIQILRHHQWQFSLSEFCHRAAKQWQMFFPGLDPEALESALVEVLKQRLSSLLEEESIDADVIAATLNSTQIIGHEIDYISQVRDRAHRLQYLRQKGRLNGIQSIVQRASRLARNSDLEPNLVCPEGVVKPKLFEKESESNLYELVQSMSPFAQEIESFDILLDCIEGASLILAQFFDGPDSVMVLCEDLSRRVNRIRLLALFSNQASCLAAFDKLCM